jgi:hypothetical protein
VETVTYSQIQELVQQLPEERLSAAYRMLQELAAYGEGLQLQLEFLRLPLPKRREILTQQADGLKGHYECSARERAEWQAGDFTDEG